MVSMDVHVSRALELLDRVASSEDAAGPVALSVEYLRDVARVETSPLNQPGADKTHVERALEAFLAGYGDIRRER
jgi:hypothetical protein